MSFVFGQVSFGKGNPSVDIVRMPRQATLQMRVPLRRMVLEVRFFMVVLGVERVRPSRVDGNIRSGIIGLVKGRAKA